MHSHKKIPAAPKGQPKDEKHRMTGRKSGRMGRVEGVKEAADYGCSAADVEKGFKGSPIGRRSGGY